MCDFESIKRNIRLVSDVHLEHYKELPDFNEIITPNISDILCLLGDIGNPYQKSYNLFLEWCRDNFGIVLLVTGNHEYYGSDIDDTNNHIQNICKKLGIIFLNNSIYIYKNIAFIGTTLWSDIPTDKMQFISQHMNDYRFIKNFTPEISNNLFYKNKNFLIDKINKFKKDDYKIVILSHHTPSTNNTSFPPYEKQLQNCAFSTDLPELIEKVDLWMYGHTHFNNENNIIYKGKTPLVSNQRGYPGKLVENFNKDFVIYFS